ncbi:MAG: Protein-glutamate methylesterase/protein-glutamine glutaminase [Chroococcidiopsis cubana SAG 39.79]|uniref:protein-glutamate methylesterase n=1 Tax=Chroococcidiopsis cubana SAG 39.79 TaxID=388085 RepID=A0AB37UCU3_9CYAN|nr:MULTISPECIES: chemotaxis protein CheB [Chroococcidiopsis]MDZ4876469.1 Protein-glutamate methylesterase/protein-glutamine glutaminase [Chroococcidiopsis cubana SAG 39.79]PSB57601.1 chemotaxis protein CheB [Chroococcidiopsis cubana CCALA 043]RUT05363.1 chemotaxis protein CheB [Chroococcidiopsis cubana SAG 39.79]URD49702.1 chemotaxis protein CheB [Chroococcidiopsis sp. CCNUC1]
MNSKHEHKIFSHFPNVAFNVVAIAASKGGLNAISQILSTLPSDFPAAIAIVQHLSPNCPSYLAEILKYRTRLRVKNAETGELLRPGTVYVAVPDKHLVVNPSGKLSLSDAARVNFVRPSANVLFRSVATSYQRRAIAVILSGKDTDGLLGVLAIKKHGGIAIAQNEATCECFEMPKAAINTGKVDFVLPPNAIASTLYDLVMSPKAA